MMISSFQLNSIPEITYALCWHNMFFVSLGKNDKQLERGYHINRKLYFGGHYFVGGNGPVAEECSSTHGWIENEALPIYHDKMDILPEFLL